MNYSGKKELLKFTTLSLAVAWFSVSSCGQDIRASKVPSVVQNSVAAKFVSANNLEWKKTKNIYEAEFQMDSIEYEAWVDGSGNIVLHKMDISEKDLPQPIVWTIKRDYPLYIIEEAEKIEKGGYISYELEIEAKGKNDITLVLLPDGSIVNNTTSIKQ